MLLLCQSAVSWGGIVRNLWFGRYGSTLLSMTATLAIMPLAALRVAAQTPQVQQNLAEIKQAVAANRQALAHYTWLEQQTIIVKGEVKKEELFQVRLGPDGKPQRVLTGSTPSSPSIGKIRRIVKRNMTREYEEYAKQIGALAQSYAQSDPQRLQQAYEHGNVTSGQTGLPGGVRVMIANYIKPNDSVVIVFNRPQKMIVSLHISSYLSDPTDAVEISAQFSKLPDGTTAVSGVIVNGVSKQLTVHIQYSDYTTL
jgi:hypothetical protein